MENGQAILDAYTKQSRLQNRPFPLLLSPMLGRDNRQKGTKKALGFPSALFALTNNDA